jgi:ABC-type branched-subunit amino acid transport system substrate-binding protein
VKYRVGDKDFTGQITQLKNAKCDMVWITALPTETGAILGTAAQAKFAPRWIGQSPTWVEALVKSPLKPYLTARYWLVSEGAEYGDGSVKGMADLIAAKKQFPPKTKVADGDLYYSFGYIQAKALSAVLEQAVKDGDLSQKGILKAVQEVGTIPFDGLVGDYKYGPVDSRSPSRKSTIFAIDAKSPFGLKTLKPNFSSGAAKGLKF